jgi:hypothetical protein
MEIERINTAVKFLNNGQSFRVEPLLLGTIDTSNLYVTGWSQYIFLNNLTKQIALRELQEIKILFEEMISISQDLRGFVKNKKIEYNLVFDTGKAGVGICSEKNGNIEWQRDLC